ncbi:hypothetical protein BJX70DRAFT_397981 [Aspergillus crustosus]
MSGISGPSGLSAAHALEATGRTTVIFEQRATVGGRAQNYYEDGHAFHLGPLLVSKGSHPETMKIVNAVNVPVNPYVTSSSWMFDWTTGETWEGTSLTSPTISPGLVEEVARYRAQWQKEYKPFASSLYTNGVPDSLTASTSEWFSIGNYPLLQAQFIRLLTAWGYGDAEEVPILYALSILTPDSFAATASVVDFHEVLVRWSQQLASTRIRLASKIHYIDRTTDPITIHYTIPSEDPPSPQPCSDLILAFPPTLEFLHGAGLDLTPAESTLFSHVKTSNYFSTAVQLSHIPPLSSFSVASSSPATSVDFSGEPVFVQSMYNDSDIAIAYSLASETQSMGEVREISVEVLSRINRDPGHEGQEAIPVGEDDIRTVQHYPEHYPHVDSEVLREGWYEEFRGIQGVNRTFYTSGLNRVEHVEYAILAARDLVEEYFVSRS